MKVRRLWRNGHATTQASAKILLLGMLSAFMGFVEEGDEVIVFEPFFDQYASAHATYGDLVCSPTP